MKLLLVAVVAVVAVVAKASAQGPDMNFDKNRDGIVDKDEALAILKGGDKCWNAMLKKADANNDNKISTAELAAQMGSGPPKECSIGGGGDGGVDEPAPENNPGGGASSMKAALSLLSLLAMAASLF